MQGYSSRDRKGSLFDEWDLSEAGASQQSEVPLLFAMLSISMKFHMLSILRV